MGTGREVKQQPAKIGEYEGGCLCGDTTYQVKGEPTDPHLCSCTMCQRSSGAPTVAWVVFPLKDFKWTKNQPNMYRSSEKTQRCSCKTCGGLLGTYNDGWPNVCLTIATFKNPSAIVPAPGKHSFPESAPSWWIPKVLNRQENNLCNSFIESIRTNRVTKAIAVAGFFAFSAVLIKKFGVGTQVLDNFMPGPKPPGP